MGTLLVFLDGVGLAEPGPNNPFVAGRYPGLERIAAGRGWHLPFPPIRTQHATALALDATLGVEGLPQSGTGQATLFTGANGAALAGRHFGPYPHSATRAAIEERSVFHEVVQRGGSACFANAYPDRFFEWAEARGRWTVTSLAARTAGLQLLREEDIEEERALSADLTGAGWPGGALLPVTAAESGRRLAALTRRHSLTVFEYWLTDKAGHAREPERAERVLRTLDGFFTALVDALHPTDTLVVTSDHGNIEDLGTKGHTRNAVPLLVRGPEAPRFADAESLLDVAAPLVASALATPRSAP